MAEVKHVAGVPAGPRAGGKGRRDEDGMSVRTMIFVGLGGTGIVLGSLLLLWRGQFAAPMTYAFNTPSQMIEAGYCLAVAQDVLPVGAPIGGYPDQAGQFWIEQMRKLAEPMGPAITKGREMLSRDVTVARGNPQQWLQYAMGICSNRALMYGMKFREFE